MIVGLSHSGCTVSNLERSLRFYGETLGIEHIRSQVTDQPYVALVTGFPGCSLKIGFARIEGDGAPFEIIEFVRPAGGRAHTGFGIAGSPHQCWQVDNLPVTCRRLSQAGASFCAEEPHLLVDGPWGEAQGAFLRDPDGLLLELIELPGRRDGPGRLVSMHHFGSTVSDLDRAIDVLCNQLGLEENSRYQSDSVYLRHNAHLEDNRIRAATLLIPETQVFIDLWEFRTPSGPPADMAINNVASAHFCFLVDDIMAEHASLSERGVQFIGSPAEVTAGVNRGARAVYLMGPDSIRFELYQKPVVAAT